MRRVVCGLVLVLVSVVACSDEGASTFPAAALGTWEKSGGDLRVMKLSDGGRVDLELTDGTSCSGTWSLDNYSDTDATMSSGYIQCPPLMDGYATNELSLDGSDLVVRGTWGGTYSRK